MVVAPQAVVEADYQRLPQLHFVPHYSERVAIQQAVDLCLLAAGADDLLLLVDSVHRF